MKSEVALPARLGDLIDLDYKSIRETPPSEKQAKEVRNHQIELEYKPDQQLF